MVTKAVPKRKRSLTPVSRLKGGRNTIRVRNRLESIQYGGLIGDVSGSVIGDISGSVIGDLSGSVIGDLSGSITTTFGPSPLPPLPPLESMTTTNPSDAAQNSLRTIQTNSRTITSDMSSGPITPVIGPEATYTKVGNIARRRNKNGTRRFPKRLQNTRKRKIARLARP
jgi:hypothetical protein